MQEININGLKHLFEQMQAMWITSENNNNKLHVLKSAHKELGNVHFQS